MHDDEEELTDALDMKHKLGRALNGSKDRPLDYKLSAFNSQSSANGQTEICNCKVKFNLLGSYHSGR